MKLPFVLRIFMLLKLSLSVNSNRVNEGASTSSEVLSPEERCQIDEAVDQTVRCMFSRNLNFNGNLEEMLRTRFQVIEVLYNFYFQRIGLVLYGSSTNGVLNLLTNWEHRLRYYSLRIRLKMNEIAKEACTAHYFRDDRYTVDVANSTITFEEVVGLDQYCLCDTGRDERLCDRKLNRSRGQHKTSSIFRIGKNRPKKLLKRPLHQPPMSHYTI